MSRGNTTVNKLQELLSSGNFDHDEVICLAASLTALDYDKIRIQLAKAIGSRVTTIDEAAKNARQQRITATPRESDIFNDLEPWPEEVILESLLDETRIILKRYLFLPQHAAVIAALWIAHTHVFKAFEHTPRLNITAPEKRCGKTLFLDIIENLTPRAIRTENVTPAVLFRIVDMYSPTLLIDEYDTFLNANDELRGVLNAGHKRGGKVLRCTGDDHEPRGFKTFSPVALAGIRSLPETLHDRSIVISMMRAHPGELKERFDTRKVDGLTELARKFSRWGADHLTALERADPCIPSSVFNRTADNWRPLLAIADMAGRKWSDSARTALHASHSLHEEDSSLGILLLEDIRTMFNGNDAPFIGTTELITALLVLEDRPWQEYGHQKRQISARDVATLLKPYGIRSRQTKTINSKAYHRTTFSAAFARYLRPITETPKPANDIGKLETHEVKPYNNMVSYQYRTSPLNLLPGFGVSHLRQGPWSTDVPLNFLEVLDPSTGWALKPLSGIYEQVASLIAQQQLDKCKASNAGSSQDEQSC